VPDGYPRASRNAILSQSLSKTASNRQRAFDCQTGRIVYIVKQVGDEPIIIVKAIGVYNPKSLPLISNQVADLVDSIHGAVYRINDLTDYHITFSQLVSAIGFATQGKAGTASDLRITTLTVARDPVQHLGILVISRLLGRSRWPIFMSLEEALNHARARRGQPLQIEATPRG
jgi:hypothetical protein